MESFIGKIEISATEFFPNNFLLCDGSEQSCTDYPELFAAIGNKFGEAQTGYFRLPNLVHKFPFGVNAVEIGQTGGQNEVTLGTSNLPEHNHAVGNLRVDVKVNSDVSTTATASTGSPISKAIVGSNLVKLYNPASVNPTVVLHENTATVKGTTGNTGAAEPVSIVPSYSGVCFVIRAR